MGTRTDRAPRTVTPTAADALAARDAARRLGSRSAAGAKVQIQVVTAEGGEPVTLPESVARVLAFGLAELAAGRPVALLRVDSALTPRQAARLLGVPREYLIGLLDSGEIPARRVGERRRVRLGDVLAYRRAARLAREAAMDELVAIAQADGMGY